MVNIRVSFATLGIQQYLVKYFTHKGKKCVQLKHFKCIKSRLNAHNDDTFCSPCRAVKCNYQPKL